MRLTRLFLSSLTVLLASASTLAPDLPDGVYQSYTDDIGSKYTHSLATAT